MMKPNWRLRNRPEFATILKITWPAFIELVLSAMFGMVDMMMLGQSAVSDVAIAAVGLTNNPMNLFLGTFAAVNVGTTTAVAWAIGAGRPDEAKSLARHSLLLNFTIGLAVGLLGFTFASPIVMFMGADSQTLAPASSYMAIVAIGLVPQAITLSITSSLRGAGLTRLPMLYNLFANLLNVFGNYVLIFGKFGAPALGVTGAAISTSLSRLIGCALSLGVLFLVNHEIRLNLRERFRLKLAVVGRILKIGLPAALEQVILQTGFVLFARTVSGLGTAVFAAHQIGLSICGLTFSPSSAFGVAATTLVGQSLGAGKPALAKTYARTTHHLALICACLVGLSFLLFSHSFALLYTSDLIVAGMAGTAIKFMAIAQPGQSTNLTLAGALRGAGDTKYPLYASVAGIWIFRVLLAMLFVKVFHWGLMGAWFSITLDQYARAAIIWLRFRSDRWLKTAVRPVINPERQTAVPDPYRCK